MICPQSLVWANHLNLSNIVRQWRCCTVVVVILTIFSKVWNCWWSLCIVKDSFVVPILLFFFQKKKIPIFLQEMVNKKTVINFPLVVCPWLCVWLAVKNTQCLALSLDQFKSHTTKQHILLKELYLREHLNISTALNILRHYIWSSRHDTKNSIRIRY